MKLLKWMIALGIIGAIVYFGYPIAADLALDKSIDNMNSELDKNGNVNQIKAFIENDSQLASLIENDIKDIDESTLPFTTKEEAARTVIQKVGLGNLMEIQSKVSDGATEAEQQEIITMLEGKLTEEEMLAIKVIAYKEFVE
ncbi:hypothetical protein [Radiobacillus sp. PE A8.2]|uniref:hypothetical protein n=1 Tax=Radiobacillus sp. PE A8.2 TaxID=3380349 RepID=UPI00388F5DD2